MANIMINQVCNLQCPYCFANDFVNKEGLSVDHSKNMTEENFLTALDYANSSKTNLGIIGGEPLLHPKFRRFIELANEKEHIPSILVFTNGINLDKFTDILGCQKLHLLVNCNSPKDIGEANYEKLLNSLEKVFNPFTNNRIELGINMYKPDFDYDYIIDLVKKYNKKTLRVSICVPNSNYLKNTEPLVYFEEITPRMTEFFKALLEVGCVPHFDCNSLPLCKVTDKLSAVFGELEIYAKDRGLFFNLSSDSCCTPVLDIMPDLSVARCFGISNRRVRLTDFKSLWEIEQFYKSEYDYLGINIPVDESCIRCQKFNTNLCQGGCLAFKEQQIEQLKIISRNIYIDRRSLQ